MTAHDDVIQALQGVLGPLRGELRLIARLEDPLLGNNNPHEVFLFVPDLHLVSGARSASFGNYGFNHAKTDLLTALLGALARQRDAWENTGAHKLVTVQVGDFFDLWREFGVAAEPQNIRDDEWGGLRDVLYRGVFRARPCLKATMLLGNHDTKRGVPLAEIPFMLKACNRDPAGQPFLFTTHGDVFDVLEQFLPDILQEFAVHFLGRLTPVNKYTIGEWGKRSSRLNKPLQAMKTAIVQPLHRLLPSVGGTPTAGAPIVVPGKSLPRSLVQPVNDPVSTTQASFHRFHAALALAAASPSAARIRVVVVGHSHRAAMLWHPGPARPLLVMDVGAWIEQCEYPLEEGGTTSEPSAQLGVIHGNDARIYQVRLHS